MEKSNQKTIVQFVVNESFNDTEALKNWVIGQGYKMVNSNIYLYNNLNKKTNFGFQQVVSNGAHNSNRSTNTTIQKLPIKLGNKVLFIHTDRIKYIKASEYYAEIHTDKKEYLLRESLSNLIVKLSNTEFIRIHRSTIINLENMQELVHSNYNEIDVKMIDSTLFRVSKSYKKELFAKLGL